MEKLCRSLNRSGTSEFSRGYDNVDQSPRGQFLPFAENFDHLADNSDHFEQSILTISVADPDKDFLIILVDDLLLKDPVLFFPDPGD